MVLTAIAGLIVTIVSSYVFYRLGQRSMRESFDQQTEKLKNEYAKPISEMVCTMDRVTGILEKDHPELEQEINEVMKKNIIIPVLHIYLKEGSKCPVCKHGQLSMERYGRGPLGICAIFKCSKCSRLFQTPESP